jgi:hypothetical protein
MVREFMGFVGYPAPYTGDANFGGRWLAGVEEKEEHQGKRKKRREQLKREIRKERQSRR